MFKKCSNDQAGYHLKDLMPLGQESSLIYAIALDLSQPKASGAIRRQMLQNLLRVPRRQHNFRKQTILSYCAF